nr:immunoglobulin light chain junction region [Macaca mulatta]
CQQYNSDRYTF